MKRALYFHFLSLFLIFVSKVFEVNARADEPVFTDNFTSSYQDYNPWVCSDSSGLVTGMPGRQLVIDDSGAINSLPLSPSVAAGDLNGDGLPDLVIADPAGFFWYLQNHGTKQEPLFSNAEIMPIWLGDPCPDIYHQEGLVTHNYVPRIQLIDINGDGKLDLVVGIFTGRLFYLLNQGSAQSPVFKVPPNLDEITIPTHRDGRLWCNYLSPYLCDWQQTGVMDLLVGDGSYSANSVYYLKNKGTSDRPLFRKENMQKIIPGMGREHLIPQVIAWNGDGNKDILTSERSGYLNLFLSKPSRDNSTPAYDEGQHVMVGGQQSLKELSTVSVADLTGSGLPGLLIGTTDGHVSYAPNVGDATNFQFGLPMPIKSAGTSPSILRPYGWTLDGGYGSPYDLLVCTNAQVEPGFTPPDGAQVTTALRYYRAEPLRPNTIFPNHFYPQFDTRIINREGGFNLTAETRYTLTMWVKSTGEIRDLKYSFYGSQYDPANPQNFLGGITIAEDISAGSSWNKVESEVRFSSLSDDRHANVYFNFHLIFSGKGSLYLAAIKLEPEQ